MTNPREAGQPLSREKLRESVDSVARTGEQPTLSETAANAVFHDLGKSGSHIPNQVEKLFGPLAESSTAELERIPDHVDTYVITGQEVRGVIARAAIAGAAETLVGIAQSEREVSNLEILFIEPTNFTGTE